MIVNGYDQIFNYKTMHQTDGVAGRDKLGLFLKRNCEYHLSLVAMVIGSARIYGNLSRAIWRSEAVTPPAVAVDCCSILFSGHAAVVKRRNVVNRIMNQ